MRIAADLALVPLGLVFLLALGIALPVLATRGGELRLASEKAQALGIAMVAGVLANLAAGLLLPRLGLVLAASGALAVGSLAFALRHRQILVSLFCLGWLRWTLIASVVLAFAGPILFEPLMAWDARSIWFFHAKRIFYDGGLDAAQDWIDRVYGFSHQDYPKLLPLLAAQFAHAAGFWNEYVPKASLLAFLVPAVLGLVGIARTVGFGLLFLAIAFLLPGGELMWNGMTDAYFALYCGAALLFWSRWVSSAADLDLVAAIVYTAVPLNLKNEGALFALCIAAGLLCFRARAIGHLRRHRAGGAVALAMGVSLAGFLTWSLIKMSWHAQSDVAFGVGSITRGVGRVRDASVITIVKAFAAQLNLQAAVAALLIAAVIAAFLRATRAEHWFPAGVAALYMLGMFLVYLSTPHNLVWHLTFSVDRTLLPVEFGLFASAFLLLDALGFGWMRAAADGGPDLAAFASLNRNK